VTSPLEGLAPPDAVNSSAALDWVAAHAGDAPLPEGHTARALGDALRGIPGVPAAMVERAARGFYHDYLSPLALPEMALVGALRRLALDPSVPVRSRDRLRALAAEVIRGNWDASRAESDAWMSSAEGRAAMAAMPPGARDLFGGGRD
jgi:hypothetical protein